MIAYPQATQRRSPSPQYSLSRRAVIGLSGAILLNRRRSFRRDAQAFTSRLRPRLRLEGSENVPCAGPVLLTVNHYCRPGFQAYWLALAISAVVPAEVHWVITAALTYPGRRFSRLRRRASQWVLRRIARAYGFDTMPAMPPHPADVQARALAVRRVLGVVRQNPAALIGLAPEGYDHPDYNGRLISPPSGSGRFLLHLSRLGLEIVPVGAYEAEGFFCLNFGRRYRLEVPQGLPGKERDSRAREIAMRRIAALLPAELRGAYP